MARATFARVMAAIIVMAAAGASMSGQRVDIGRPPGADQLAWLLAGEHRPLPGHHNRRRSARNQAGTPGIITAMNTHLTVSAAPSQ